jgi:hypothetical protein
MNLALNEASPATPGVHEMEAKLVVVCKKNAGMEIPISTPRFLIGSGEDCQFRVASKRIAPRHCIVSVDDTAVVIEDCNSGGETFVNGELLQGQRNVMHGDHIAIGPMELEIRVDMDGHQESETDGDNAVVIYATGPNRDLNEVSILDWLEDGEDEGDEDNNERYWRRAARRAANGSEMGDDEISGDASNRGPGGFDGPGLDNSYGTGDATQGESPQGDGKAKKKRNTLISKIAAIVTAIFGPIIVRFQGLDRFERVLLVTVLVLAFVIMMILFPVTFVWFKAIVNVRKWSHWVWTGILVVVLGYLFWLREQYE